MCKYLHREKITDHKEVVILCEWHSKNFTVKLNNLNLAPARMTKQWNKLANYEILRHIFLSQRSNLFHVSKLGKQNLCI